MNIGFALTGSFCTLSKALAAMQQLVDCGWQVTPIYSEHTASLDTRFGCADEWQKKMSRITPCTPILSIPDAEPIGPKKMFDALVIAPCTGNTLGKLANGITDNTVTMAVKSHLRNGRPVVLAISTNDALSGSAKSIGDLLNRRHYFFVPLRQDAPSSKPCSLVAEFPLLQETITQALSEKQLQPLFLSPGET